MALAINALFPELGTGLVTGSVASAAILAVGLIRSRRASPVPLAGLGLAAAGVFGLGSRLAAQPRVMVGLLLLALAGLVIDLWPKAWLGAPLLALPGAIALAVGTQALIPGQAGGRSSSAWVVPVVIAVVVVGGTLVGCFDSRWRSRGFGPILLALTLVGVYLTVPETKRTLVLMGAAVVIALTAWPVPLASVGWAGSLAATGLVVSMTVLDGLDRPSSIVGAVACLGLLIVEPMARALVGGRQSPLDALPTSWWSVPVVAAAHLAIVLVASRVAGLRVDVNSAALVASVDLGVALLVAVGVAVILDARNRRPLGY